MSFIFSDHNDSDAIFVTEKKKLKENRAFDLGKRAFDVVLSIALLPLLGLVSFCLFVLNPFYNRGNLLFVQKRMGYKGSAFSAIKFRTMRPAAVVERCADDPLEVERITHLGGILRKTRLDELPQILNVLRGEMSLIGPRPDFFSHAEHFCKFVPSYEDRLAVLPGISGLAQTEIGYVEGVAATRRKVAADLYYIHNRGLRLELWVIWRTFAVIFSRAGA